MRENLHHNAPISSQLRAHPWVVEQWVQGLAVVGDLELDRAVCELIDFESAHLRPAVGRACLLTKRWRLGRKRGEWKVDVKMKSAQVLGS